MRRVGMSAILGVLMLVVPASAQTPRPPGAVRPVRVVIANGRLSSVTGGPLHFKLLRVTLGAGQASECVGPDGMLYVLSGGIDGIFDGEKRAVREGSAAFLPAGRRSTLNAIAGAPAVMLHFLLAPASDLSVVPCGRPAAAAELHLTPRPIEGLKPGPYEFTMTRVSVERGVPRPPMHHRTGAALYYTLAGTWTLHRQEAASAPRARGAIQFEPYDFIHTWENTGETTGILLQANISPEGAPEIVFLPTH
jgi:quercetin dioxygenase-like cupin family protein